MKCENEFCALWDALTQTGCHVRVSQHVEHCKKRIEVKDKMNPEPVPDEVEKVKATRRMSEYILRANMALIADVVQICKYSLWNSNVGDDYARDILGKVNCGKYGNGLGGIWPQVDDAISNLETELFE